MGFVDTFKLYLLVLSSWKVNIAKNPIVVMGLYVVRSGKVCLVVAKKVRPNKTVGNWGELAILQKKILQSVGALKQTFDPPEFTEGSVSSRNLS